MANLAELQQEREKLLNEVREISERSTAAGKVTADDKQAADVRSKRLNEIEDVIELQRITDRAAGITTPNFGGGRQTAPNGNGNRSKNADPQAAVKAWLRGSGKVDDAEMVRSAGYDYNSPVLDFNLPGSYGDSGLRANQASGNNQLGGYTIEGRLSDTLVKETVTYGSVRNLSFQFQLDSTGDVTVPTNDDTANEGEMVDESAQGANQNNVSFGSKTIKLQLWNTGQPFRLPYALIEDSKFDLIGLIENLGLERILRAENRQFTLGTGSGTIPEGVTVGAQNYKTFNNGAANVVTSAITTDDLIAMQDDLDDSYDANARWMFSKSFKTYLRTLKFSDGRYVFTLGDIRVGTPDTVLGKPFSINNHMASTGANAVPVLYGDFRAAYWVRNGLTFQFKRLVEKYVEYGQVGLIGFYRSGGKVVKPSALRSIKLAASGS